MIRLHCFGFAFTPRRIPTIFLLIALPILISLGIWQLHRAEEKQHLQNQTRQQATLELKDINKHPLKNLQYRSIHITGHFDNQHQLLLDNKVMNHRVGYEVITPFFPDNSNRMIMVNRGWIAGTGDRQQLPKISGVSGHQTIQGLIKITPTKAFVLSEDGNFEQWPALIQAIDMEQLSKLYRKPFYPFIVLLSPQSPGGFVRRWRPIVMPPAKHLGYAIQWFALALTLVIMYFALQTKREVNE